MTLARRQLQAGSAVGMTCAKLSEAEVLARGGVSDILIANQVVGRPKMARLVDLARQIDLKVAVDDIVQAEAISQAAAAAGVTVGILVEVDIGTNRCGVAPGEATLRLAQAILPLKGLRFDGLQAYEGHAVYVDDPAERADLVRESFDKALHTRRLLEDHGIKVRIVSGGSSSTHAITGCIDGVDEIQAGSYATMDWRYAQMLPDFEVALSVLARVISKRPGVAVLDVGLEGCRVRIRSAANPGSSAGRDPQFRLGRTLHCPERSRLEDRPDRVACFPATPARRAISTAKWWSTTTDAWSMSGRLKVRENLVKCHAA